MLETRFGPVAWQSSAKVRRSSSSPARSRITICGATSSPNSQPLPLRHDRPSPLGAACRPLTEGADESSHLADPLLLDCLELFDLGDCRRRRQRHRQAACSCCRWPAVQPGAWAPVDQPRPDGFARATTSPPDALKKASALSRALPWLAERRSGCSFGGSWRPTVQSRGISSVTASGLDRDAWHRCRPRRA